MYDSLSLIELTLRKFIQKKLTITLGSVYINNGSNLSILKLSMILMTNHSQTLHQLTKNELDFCLQNSSSTDTKSIETKNRDNLRESQVIK